MKKFLKKLPVMITFWCVTAVLLTVMIVMAARPVSYGWAYKGEMYNEELGEDAQIELVFENKSEIEMHMEVDSLTVDMGIWYVLNGRQYSPVALSYVPSSMTEYLDFMIMTENEYEQTVRDTKANRQVWNEIWANADSINAFKCEFEGEEFVCNGAIVFTVIFGVLVAATLTFSVLSTIAFVKGRKEKPEQTEPEHEENNA